MLPPLYIALCLELVELEVEVLPHIVCRKVQCSESLPMIWM